jgi:hypothetical protein
MVGLDTRKLEASAYRDSYSDGLLDTFFGLSLIWVGVCWLWIEPLAGLAAIFPAALLPVVIIGRRRVVESRTGYVRWTSARREWEARALRGFLVLGVALLLLIIALVAYRLASGEMADAGEMVAGLPALLIAIPVLLLAAASGIRRLWAYLLVLLAAALMTPVLGLDPGPGLLLSGVIVSLSGLTLLARFLRSTAAGDA